MRVSAVSIIIGLAAGQFLAVTLGEATLVGWLVNATLIIAVAGMAVISSRNSRHKRS